MENNQPAYTVNESILLLKKDVQNLQQGQDRNYNNLKSSQDTFHSEMKESFKDLKDNYSAKLTGLDEHLSKHDERLGVLETSKTRQNVTMSIGIAILSILVGLLTYHIVK